MHEEIRPRVVEATADELSRHFKPESFHLVVCHLGAHLQEKQAAEGALKLLKPGGHLIMTGERHTFTAKRGIAGNVPVTRLSYILQPSLRKNFKLRQFKTDYAGRWSVHMQKPETRTAAKKR